MNYELYFLMNQSGLPGANRGRGDSRCRGPGRGLECKPRASTRRPVQAGLGVLLLDVAGSLFLSGLNGNGAPLGGAAGL